jgi:serine/threonine-protein phosphatase 2B catalytic subunit
MLLAILSICSAEELEESSEETTDVSDGEGGKPVVLSPRDLSARKQQIKNKILAVGRMQRVFTALRYAHPLSDPTTLLTYLCAHRREEAEGASELAQAGNHSQNIPIPGPAGSLGTRLGADALGVHGGQWIRSFDDACVHSFPDFLH